MRGDAIIAVQVHKLGVGEGVAPDVAKYRRAMPAQLLSDQLNAQACRSPKGNFASFVHIEMGVGRFMTVSCEGTYWYHSQVALGRESLL